MGGAKITFCFIFGDVKPFLQDLEACPAARQHLLDVLHNEYQHKQLCMELAITINAGLPIVEKTYSMEGDGEIIVETYENLQQLATSAALKNVPNAKVMAKTFAGDDDAATEAIFQAALRCVQPAMTYFLQKFNHALRQPAIQHGTPIQSNQVILPIGSAATAT